MVLEVSKPGATGAFVLKDGDAFMVCDARGNIDGSDDGLFIDDTRWLSRFELMVSGHPPALLSAAMSRDNVFFTANMTVERLPVLGGPSPPTGVVHLERKRFLCQGRLHERLTLTNYGDAAANLPLELRHGADFHDMFEIRGTPRRARGQLLPPEVSASEVRFPYQGLDGQLRTLAITFEPAPQALDAECATFAVAVEPHRSSVLHIDLGPVSPNQPGAARYRAAAADARRAMRSRERRGARMRTSGRLFNEWIRKSRADLALLTTELGTGPYPYAGIPWFSTPFGRDAIITSLQTLWLDPELAKGVLTYLAHHQAREVSAFPDAEPGKIMHETRKSEMSALKEVPFERYYGGVDTTPLFVMLAGAYVNRTQDLEFIDTLWSALTEAMRWIESAMASSPGGFLTYQRGEETGLVNQGWKDSHDSVFHADGTFARGAIAMVEVQGYVHAALMAMSTLARRRSEMDAADHWLARARALRRNIESVFWMPDRNFYGLALDGDGRLCRVCSSNPGHILYTGIPSASRARSVVNELLRPRFNTGWGIRTIARGETRYNPMSYHNGTVWPHDTALAAAGMARYGERIGVVRLLSGLFEAADQFGMRLPELFCGFDRTPGEPPTAYPVACLPQAWAAGSAFMMLQACLGIGIEGRYGRVRIDRPRLPIGIDQLRIEGLIVGPHQLDLVFQRVGDRVAAYGEGDGAEAVPVLVRA